MIFQFDDLNAFRLKIGAELRDVDVTQKIIVDNKLRFLEPGARLPEDKVIYIRDRQEHEEYKYHICNCATINGFIRSGYFEYRYRQTDIKDIQIDKKTNKHFFQVHYINRPQDKQLGYEAMKVCKNCLESLNYKDFRKADTPWKRNKIVNKFNILDFLEENGYTVNYPSLEARKFIINRYPDNWPEISYRLREIAEWKCSRCGEDCSSKKDFLVVHHRNHDKSDCREVNLQVLCKNCHKKVHEI